MKFINKNHAFERSQKYHDLHSSNDIRNENYLISEYHSRIYYWQSKYNVIMPKKLRKNTMKNMYLRKVNKERN